MNTDKEELGLKKGIFSAIRQESAVDRVINTIKQALITRKLLPGDKLSSEIELSKDLSISRGSVREAMRVLSAFGIVEIRRGDGTYISQSDKKVIFDPLLFNLILSRAHKKELVELRELMECAIVKLIIENAEEADLLKLKHAVDEMGERTHSKHGNRPEELAQSDLSFHKAMGEATKNKLVEKIYDFVMDFFAPWILLTHKNQEKGKSAYVLHQSIYQSLVNRDFKEALVAVKNSIDAWKELSMPVDVP